MVVLVDDGDGARMQVDPEEVGPHLHAALQLVALLNSRQPAVDRIHAHRACCHRECGDAAAQATGQEQIKVCPDVFYPSNEVGSSTDLLGPGSAHSEETEHTLDLLPSFI